MIEPRMGLILNFSNYHIRSAIHLAYLSYITECRFNTKQKRIPLFNHRAYVTSCIFLSVAFLEATINELIFGVSIGSNPWDEGNIDKDKYETLKNIGTIEGTKNLSTLDKYQIVLSVLGSKLFSTGKSPYQNVRLLIRLRNNLIHFEPEHIYLTPKNKEEEHKLQRSLIKKFPPNPIAEYMKRHYYPDILLGYGCAKWSVNSCIEFVKEFNSRINLTARYFDSLGILP
jgi:hypothetical protein